MPTTPATMTFLTQSVGRPPKVRHILTGRHLEASILFGLAFSLATSILITRTGGAAVRGQVTTVAVWAQLLGWLACFSMDKAIVDGARRSRDAIPDLTKYALRRVSWNLVVASVVAFVILSRVLPDYRLVIVGLIAVSITAYAEVFAGILLAERKLRTFSLLRLAQPVVYFAAAAAAWLVIQGGLRLPKSLSVFFSYALAASLAAQLFLSVALTRDALRHSSRPKRSLPRHRRRSFLHFSAAAQLASSLQYVNSRLDLLVLPFVASASTVGIYAVASTCAQFVGFGGTASFLRHFSLGDQKRDVPGLMLALLLAGCLIVSAPWLLPAVFGSQFSASVGLCRVLALGGVASFGMQAANGVLLAHRRPRAVTWAQGIGAAVFAVGIAVSTAPMFIALMSTTSYVAAWVVAECLIRFEHSGDRLKLIGLDRPDPVGEAGSESPAGQR